MSRYRITVDHEEIQHWAEQRRGIPVRIEGVECKDPGEGIQILFPEQNSSSPTVKIKWEEFFNRFEDKLLALELEEGDRDNQLPNHYKFVGRNL